MKGWIKWHRKELEWALALTDQEFRYYYASRQVAIWDPRSIFLGTFDARTKIVQKEMFPDWSFGKINMTKNALLRKGFYQKTDDHRRLCITNAHILFKRGEAAEIFIYRSESNLLANEYDFQQAEKRAVSFERSRTQLALSKRIDSPFNSTC